MTKQLSKKTSGRRQTKARVRSKIFGTGKQPRLSVFRSGKNIYAQLINDEKGITLAAADSGNIKVKDKPKKEQAILVGKELARRATEKGFTKVSFDRNGYRYHGRVKELAEGARAGGLKF